MSNGHYKTQEEFEEAIAKIPEQCELCEHFMCFPHLRWVYCQKRKPFKEDCDKFLDIYKHRSRNADKEPLPVKWVKEYAYTTDRLIDVPLCPACNEYAEIDLGHCRFCGQPFVQGEDKREPSIEIYYVKDGHEWKLVEVGQYHHWWIFKDGQEIMHTQNTKKHSEQQLKQELKKFVEDGVYEKLLEIAKEKTEK